MDNLNAAALDDWIERLVGRYSEGRFTRSAQTTLEPSGQVMKAPVMSDRLQELGGLLRAASQGELRRLAGAAGLEPEVSANVARFRPETWADETELLRVLRIALEQLMRAGGKPEGAIKAVTAMDADTWLRTLRDSLESS